MPCPFPSCLLDVFVRLRPRGCLLRCCVRAGARVRSACCLLCLLLCCLLTYRPGNRAIVLQSAGVHEKLLKGRHKGMRKGEDFVLGSHELAQTRQKRHVRLMRNCARKPNFLPYWKAYDLQQRDCITPSVRARASSSTCFAISWMSACGSLRTCQSSSAAMYPARSTALTAIGGYP